MAEPRVIRRLKHHAEEQHEPHYSDYQEHYGQTHHLF